MVFTGFVLGLSSLYGFVDSEYEGPEKKFQVLP
jgi:hypothetical protein